VTRLILLTFLFSAPALGLSPEAREFMAISKQLEPVQCQKRKLRREIALTEIERRDGKALHDRFASINRDAQTTKLEQRLAQLEPRVVRSTDPEDLAAISRQQREAFYRCE
jgi:TolA-binding protein